MSSNGSNSKPDDGIKAPDAGLDKSAITQWKFNALAKKFPDIADIIEDAKKLIGKSAPVPEVAMTVSEVAQRLTSLLEHQIKPAQVNQALVELGFQVRPDNGKRIWQLTEPGKEYGTGGGKRDRTFPLKLFRFKHL